MSGGTAARAQQSRRAIAGRCFETLESRRLFAADIELLQANHELDRAVVEYQIHEQSVPAFQITAYESPDGFQLGSVLASERVDTVMTLEVGKHVTGMFWEHPTDLKAKVVVVVDSKSEVAETDEGNNCKRSTIEVKEESSLSIDGVIDNEGTNASLGLSLEQISTLQISWGDDSQIDVFSDPSEMFTHSHDYPHHGEYVVKVKATGSDGKQFFRTALFETSLLETDVEGPSVESLVVAWDQELESWVVRGQIQGPGKLAKLKVLVLVDGKPVSVVTDENGAFVRRIGHASLDVLARVQRDDGWWSDWYIWETT